MKMSNGMTPDYSALRGFSLSRTPRFTTCRTRGHAAQPSLTPRGRGPKWPPLAKSRRYCGRLRLGGAVAQLGERLVRNEEVRGSTPLGSTSPLRRLPFGFSASACSRAARSLNLRQRRASSERRNDRASRFHLVCAHALPLYRHRHGDSELADCVQCGQHAQSRRQYDRRTPVPDYRAGFASHPQHAAESRRHRYFAGHPVSHHHFHSVRRHPEHHQVLHLTHGTEAAQNRSMTARIIDGKAIAADLRAAVAAETRRLTADHGLVPGLAVVLIGDNPASKTYVASKSRALVEVGMRPFDHHLPATTTEAELLTLVGVLNVDPAVHGILVQLPLPRQINQSRVIAAIDPDKDVDGFHPLNAGRLMSGLPALVPCTPVACLKLIKTVH